MSSFKNKSIKFVTGSIIGLIVISFIFTLGYDTSSGRVGHVAQVGAQKISFEEFDRELSQQIQFYKRLTGGKDLTQQQIDQFRLKHSALSRLIERKLLINAAADFGVQPGDISISEEIKQLPYFKTNGMFDLLKYKQLIQGSNYTSATFEALVKDDLVTKEIQKAITQIPVSDNYLKDIISFKNETKQVNAAVLRLANFNQYVVIKDAEIEAFLKDEANLQTVKDEFAKRAPSLSKPRQIKASHILFSLPPGTEGDAAKVEKKAIALRKKLTKKNFKRLANKNTEDPSGKGKGGSLGWFSKGRMVPEFEKAAFTLKKGEISQPIKTVFGYHIIMVEDVREPVIAKYEKHERRITEELLQAKRNKEAEVIQKNIAKQLIEKAGNAKEFSAIANQYSVTALTEKEINRLDGKVAGVSLTGGELKSIFTGDKNKVHEFKKGVDIVVVKVLKDGNKKDEKKTEAELIAREKSGQKLELTNKFRTELMDTLWENTTIKCLGAVVPSAQHLNGCQL